MTSEIIVKANNWINNKPEFEKEMIILEEGVKEHKYCYSLPWCIKSELNLKQEERTSWIGIGRILISKDGRMIEFEGSSPEINWIHYFELKAQNLEEYWILKIPYSKDKISILKSTLKNSTADLVEKINNNNEIILTKSKKWNTQNTELNIIFDDLNNLGIPCKLEIKIRKTITKI